jgi:hypothetical protein
VSSASAGVGFEGVKADLEVAVTEAGAVDCRLTVNGRPVKLVFGTSGDVDVDVEPPK